MKLLLTFFLLIFISKSYAQDYDLDSLVKTHKKVAILPVRVIYHFDGLANDTILNDIEEREIEDGLVVQEKFCTQLRKKNKSLTVEIQSSDETRRKIRENAIEINDLEGFSRDSLSKILEVDGIIDMEFEFHSITKNKGVKVTSKSDYVIGNSAKNGMITGAAQGNYLPLAFTGLLMLASRMVNFDGEIDFKRITFKSIISDGNTGEIIKRNLVTLGNNKILSDDKLLEFILWEYFDHSPYHRR